MSSFGQIVCALNKKILDLLNKESISGACIGRELVYKYNEKLEGSLKVECMFERELQMQDLVMAKGKILV